MMVVLVLWERGCEGDSQSILTQRLTVRVVGTGRVRRMQMMGVVHAYRVRLYRVSVVWEIIIGCCTNISHRIVKRIWEEDCTNIGVRPANTLHMAQLTSVTGDYRRHLPFSSYNVKRKQN